jgi:hypothetical protein
MKATLIKISATSARLGSIVAPVAAGFRPAGGLRLVYGLGIEDVPQHLLRVAGARK